jgi:DNA repair protein RadD
MQLRDYQIEFVDKCSNALLTHGNTIGVAPTGAGKTVILASVIKKLHEQKKFFKVCVLAHRKELTEQNIEKFSRVNPHITTSIVNADVKNWSGEVTFAMVQTLATKRTLNSMPFLDLLVIDETHHITANSYGKIIKQARSVNPDVMIFGVTATPNRGDKANLGKFFNNCASQIKLVDLIDDGYLVEPITYVVDVAQERLEDLEITKLTGDYNDKEVAEILNTNPITEQVIDTWKQYAKNRKTVIFCSTIEHSHNVAEAFNARQIPTLVVSSEMTKKEREDALQALVVGKIQVIVNVAILTEGWDFPPISCVVLLRQSSYKSTMIQMIGRGLRTIDPAIYPNIEKKDCIVLDFGISSVLHKTLDDWVKLEREKEIVDEKKKEKGYDQECPKCENLIPLRVKECPLCGHEFEQKDMYKLGNNYVFIEMKKIEMLKRSQADWANVGTVEHPIYFCCGFKVWVSIIQESEKWLVSVVVTQKMRI